MGSNPIFRSFRKKKSAAAVGHPLGAAAFDSVLYGTGLKTGQGSLYPTERGSFGRYGSIAENGCGAFAVQNVLTILGYRCSFAKLLERFNRDRRESVALGGLLGSRFFYILSLLKAVGVRTKCTFSLPCLTSAVRRRKKNKYNPLRCLIRRQNRSNLYARRFDKRKKAAAFAEFAASKRCAYLVLYAGRAREGGFHAHYQAIKPLPHGRLQAYNGPDGIFESPADFMKKSGSWGMIWVRCERSGNTDQT